MVTLQHSNSSYELYFEINEVVLQQTADFMHFVWFDDFDIKLTDRIQRRMTSLIESGEIIWAERKCHIVRLVNKHLSLEKRSLQRNERRMVRDNGLNNPLDSLVATWGDPELQFLENQAEAELAELKQTQIAAENEYIQQIVAFAQCNPAKHQQRIVSVLLITRKENKSYAEIAKLVAQLGFGNPSEANLRQWQKRHSINIVNQFQDFLSQRN